MQKLIDKPFFWALYKNGTTVGARFLKAHGTLALPINTGFSLWLPVALLWVKKIA
jgi:hypothetical protein